MISSFIDLQTLGLFVLISLLFMIASFRFNFSIMKNYPGKLAIIFLVSGFLVGFSDTILFLQDKESSELVNDHLALSKQIGIILLAPFYGVLFAAVTWFSASSPEEVKLVK